MFAKIAAEISPQLNERSVCWFLARQYVLALFFPALGTSQVGTSPAEPHFDAAHRPDHGELPSYRSALSK